MKAGAWKRKRNASRFSYLEPIAAIADGERTIPGDAVIARSAAIARDLRAAGITRGEVIAVAGDRGADSLLAALGIMRAGAAFLALDDELPTELFIERLRLTKARLVIVPQASAIDSEQVGKEVSLLPLPDDLCEPFDLFLRDSDTAYVVFTSGTTGTPRSIYITHGNIASYSEAIAERIGIDAFRDAVVATPAALSVDLGFTAIFPGLSYSAGICVPAKGIVRDPAALARTLKNSGVDLLKVTPSHLAAVLDVTDVLPRRTLVFGGEPLAIELVRRLKLRRPDMEIYNHYGPAETCVGVSAGRVDSLDLGMLKERGLKSVPVGRALKNVLLRLDTTSLSVGPDRGELVVAGPTVSSDARTHDQAKSGSFRQLADGYEYRTGDISRYFDDIGFVIEGRIDRQIKIDGRRVEPLGVEAAIRSVDGIRDVAVGVRYLQGDVTQICAWVVLTQEFRDEALQKALRAKLNQWEIPSSVFAVADIPRTASGKVDFAALATPSASSIAVEREGSALKTLLFHLSTLTGHALEPDSKLDDFSLRSITLIRLIGRAAADGLRLTVSDAFLSKTPRELADRAKHAAPLMTESGSLASERPATVYEESVWLASRIASNDTYALRVCLEVADHRSVHEIRDAWIATLNSHQSLKCRIIEAAELRLRFDGSIRHSEPVDGPTPDEDVEEWAERSMQAFFALELDPIMGVTARSSVLPISSGRTWVLLSAHHIACDGRSVQLLIERFSQNLDRRDYPTLRPQTESLPAEHAVATFRSVSRDRMVLDDVMLAVSKESSASSFAILLACWSVVLWSARGSESSIAVLADVRASSDEYEVGYFVNPLPFVLAPVPNESLRAFISSTHRVLIEGLGSRHKAYAEAVRGPGFVYPTSAITFDDYLSDGTANRVRRRNIGHFPPMFGLDLSIVRTHEGWTFVLSTNGDESPEVLSALLARLEGAIRRLHEDSRVTIDRAIQPDEVRAARIRAFGSGRRTKVISHGLAEPIVARISASPDDPAIIDCGKVRTLRDLDIRSRQWLHVINKARCAREVPIAIDLPLGLDELAAILAVSRAGYMPLPLDPLWPADRKQVFAKHCSVILTDKQCYSSAVGVPADDEPIADGVDRSPSAEETAYIIATSGSTGIPKLITLSHFALANHFAWHGRIRPFAPDDVVLLWTTPCFDNGIWERFAPLGGGARVAIPSPLGARDPITVAATINDQSITMMQSTPTLLNVLAREIVNPPSLRDVISGGELLTSRVLRTVANRWPSTRIHDIYGPAEAVIDTATRLDCHDREGFGTFDAFVDNVAVQIVTPSGRLCDVGERGEIFVAAPNTKTAIYLDDPKSTSQAFVPSRLDGNRVFKTGDAAFWDSEGRLRILGRVDRRIKINGERMELEELESLIAGHHGVRDAAVILLGIDVAAFVEPDDVDVRSIRDSLTSVVPAPFVPSRWAVLKELPRTPSGKIDRGSLDANLATLLSTRHSNSPLNELEQKVAAVWTEVIGQESPVDVGFFQAGGNSLMLLRLRQNLNQAFSSNIGIADLFEASTIRSQAALIAGSTVDVSSDRNRESRQRGISRLAQRRKG